jgi:hypothetical protein
VITVAAAVVLVVLIVTVSMRAVKGVPQNGGVRFGVTHLRPESEQRRQSTTAILRRRAGSNSA